LRAVGNVPYEVDAQFVGLAPAYLALVDLTVVEQHVELPVTAHELQVVKEVAIVFGLNRLMPAEEVNQAPFVADSGQDGHACLGRPHHLRSHIIAFHHPRATKHVFLVEKTLVQHDKFVVGINYSVHFRLQICKGRLVLFDVFEVVWSSP